MDGSVLDVINAAVEVGIIVDDLIEGLKVVCECKDEWRNLGVALEGIQPLLRTISTRYKHHHALETWLNAIKTCVEDVRVILEKCKRPNRWRVIWRGSIRLVSYGGEVLNFRDRILELAREAALLLSALERSRIGIMRDVPGKIIGMEDYFKQVKSVMCEAHSKKDGSCVGIRGMGGVGKTLLAQMVNNDEIQQVYGKDFVIWIKVGHDANILEIYNQMRIDLQVPCDGSLEDQRKDLMNAFEGAGALLILDDVRDGCVHEGKDLIYWLNIAKGSKCVTLITTREESVTRQWDVVGEVLISQLSPEQSWELFCLYAFDTDTPTFDSMDDEDLVMALCEQCNRLPLALEVVGCTMKSQSDWKTFLHALKPSPKSSVFDVLRVSYDVLDEPTRICFLYFAAFPDDYKLSVKELCQIWVVEGLFGETLSEQEAWEKADCALEELVRRSLIEVAKVDNRGTLAQVKMHDLLREFAIQLVSKDIECERESLFKMEKAFVEFPRTWLDCELKVKRLSLWGGNMGQFPDEILAPKLKICMLHGDQWVKSKRNLVGSSLDCNIGERFFGKLHALKFLQICGFENVIQLPKSIGGLRFLQHLNLSRCVALKELPKSMEELRYLQHLNLSQCLALRKLPKHLGRLRSLVYLDLSECYALKHLPMSMGELVSLQHLNLSGCGALKELPESIGGLRSLQHLNLSQCWALEKLPKIGDLDYLEFLDLSECYALKQLPMSIGKLESLQYLNLSYCDALMAFPAGMKELWSL